MERYAVVSRTSDEVLFTSSDFMRLRDLLAAEDPGKFLIMLQPDKLAEPKPKPKFLYSTVQPHVSPHGWLRRPKQ